MQLSIITVNLNNYQGLRKTLESVAEQSFRNYEQIVIDGGSTDGSVDLLKQWAPKLAFTNSESDSGIYHAMNKGVRVARGKYLLFMNSGDTLLEEHSLNLLFTYMEDADIVYGNALATQGTTTQPLNFPECLTLEYFFVTSIGHQSALIRRNLLLRYPYDETLRIVSDWKFFFTCYLKGYTFKHIDQVISRFDATGISSQPEYHTLHRQERDKVMHTILNTEKRKKIAGNVALSFLPKTLRPLFCRAPAILYSLYLLGRKIRQIQTQWTLLRTRKS